MNSKNLINRTKTNYLQKVNMVMSVSVYFKVVIFLASKIALVLCYLRNMLHLADYVLTRNCCPPGSGLPGGQLFFNKSIKSFFNWWSGCVFRISIRLPKAIFLEKALERNCCPPGSEIFHCPVGSSFF